MKTTMCKSCGGPLRRERIVRAFAPELPDVIVDGLEREICATCADVATAYKRPLEVSRIVVQALLDKRGRLAPGEVAWLRGGIGMRRQDLADTLGVTPSQVSRWESGARPISALADRLLRVLAANAWKLAQPDLKQIDARHAEPVSLRVVLGDHGWRVAEPERATG